MIKDNSDSNDKILCMLGEDSTDDCKNCNYGDKFMSIEGICVERTSMRK